MAVNVVELTTPPLDMTSAPGPGVLKPPTARPVPKLGEPPTFQVEPVPVTVTVGVPMPGMPMSISARSGC
jgi:hypothetical protein